MGSGNYTSSNSSEGVELVVRNGRLEFEGGKKVPVFSGPYNVYVGCHKLTREAWELLKKIVDNDN